MGYKKKDIFVVKNIFVINGFFFYLFLFWLLICNVLFNNLVVCCILIGVV